MADRVESVIRDRIVFLAANREAGHWRKNLTDEAVRFFPVYSYLIVYRPETTPLQIVLRSSPAPRRGTTPPGPPIEKKDARPGRALSQ
jgi:hypothetical protein